MKYTLIALCPEELKPVIIDELKSLGAYSIQPSYKAISFEVSERLLPMPLKIAHS